MRYFAVMADNRILPAKDICRDQWHIGIHFSIGFTRFKYWPSWFHDYEETKVPKYCRLYTYPNFFKQIDTDWFATKEVKMLIQLDETEDTDLNYFQSTDFNAGVIYGKIEKNIVNMIKNINSASSCFVGELCIPAIQLIPSKGYIGCAEGELIETTVHTVIEHFDAVYGKSFTLNISSWKRDKQYFKFDFSIERKEIYKEMTVAEIEAELGYKIKVVSDKE